MQGPLILLLLGSTGNSHQPLAVHSDPLLLEQHEPQEYLFRAILYSHTPNPLHAEHDPLLGRDPRT